MPRRARPDPARDRTDSPETRVWNATSWSSAAFARSSRRWGRIPQA